MDYTWINCSIAAIRKEAAELPAQNCKKNLIYKKNNKGEVNRIISEFIN